MLDIRLREVEAKRRLNVTSKVNTRTDGWTDTQTDILTYRKHRPRGPMLWKYKENGIITLKFMKHFLDDILMLYTGSIKNLHRFFWWNKLNPPNYQIHYDPYQTKYRNIWKLHILMSTYEFSSIPWYTEIVTDLFRKLINRNCLTI